jgi:hypothetical protein
MHICLFGDGDIDFRNILSGHLNAIPAFQYTDPFINEVQTYTTDDFYANVSGNDNVPDIAIGRIPVQSLKEVNDYLNKVDNMKTLFITVTGARLGFVADDGKTTSGNDGPSTQISGKSLQNFIYPQSFKK